MENISGGALERQALALKCAENQSQVALVADSTGKLRNSLDIGGTYHRSPIFWDLHGFTLW